jgi:hypothetical protein
MAPMPIHVQLAPKVRGNVQKADLIICNSIGTSHAAAPTQYAIRHILRGAGILALCTQPQLTKRKNDSAKVVLNHYFLLMFLAIKIK